MSLPDWFPEWTGETCIIVASGPSAKDVPLKLAEGKARFIAVNKSIELWPAADVWYGCDFAFWKSVQGGGGFAGVKASIDAVACRTWPDIHHIECRKVTDIANLGSMNTVGWGGNSGFHALQIAVKAGCKKVLLVGMDMTLSHGVHWHGRHPEGMSNPRNNSVVRWGRAVDGAAQEIANMGVKVFNCSPISALRKYPKATLEAALAA